MKSTILLFSLAISSIAFAAPKAIPHESLLNLVQAQSNTILSDVRVTSSTSFKPVSICGSPEKVFYFLDLQIKKKVRVGAIEFKDQWVTVKTYNIPADEVDGKDESELASNQLMDPDTCVE